MGNPGSFPSSRGVFLDAQKEAYAAAVVGNYVADCVADIQRRYFKRYPLHLDHEKEPTPEWLAAVDDNAADPEPVAPDEESMLSDVFAAAQAAWEERRRLLKFRKNQIKRRMAYTYAKNMGKGSSRTTGVEDSMMAVAARLTDVSLSKPRQPIPYNLWAAAKSDIVDKAFERERRLHNPDKKQLVNVRSTLTRKLFMELPEEEQKEWGEKAREEHALATAAWMEKRERPASTAPEDRQRCIEGLSAFAQPILDLICEHTGMKASLLVGGPEPADGGRINVISIHSGTTQGTVKSTFGQSERAAYKSILVPLFGRFLKKCYTIDECRARALPDYGPSLQSILAEQVDGESTTLHSADWNQDSSIPSPTTSSSPALALALAPAPSSTGPGSSSPPSTAPSAQLPAPLPPALASEIHPPSYPSPRGVTPQNSPSPRQLLPPSPGISLPPSPLCSPARPRRSLPPSRHTSPLPLRFPSPSSPSPSSPSPLPQLSLPPPPATPSHLVPPNPSPLWPPIACLTPLPPTSSLSPPEGSPSAPVVRSPTLVVPLPKAPKCKSLTEGGPCPSAKRQNQGTSRWASGGGVGDLKAQTSKSGTGGRGDAHGLQRGDISNAEASSSVHGTSPSAFPPNVPSWFPTASAMLRSEPLGEMWFEAVSLWEAFEAMEGFAPALKLSSTHRPPLVSQWIQRARSSTWRPAIHDVDEVADKFMAWWRVLQPGWRVASDGSLGRGTGSWEALRRSGANGLLSVMAALFFWGESIGGKGVKWVDAVADVSWVLQEMLASSTEK